MESVNSTINKELELLKNYLTRYLDFVENVYVVPHKNMDFDAIAASAAMCEITSKFGKNCYIVTDDKEELMEINLKKIYDTLKTRYNFITTSELNNIRIDNEKELVTIIDINKPFLIPIDDILSTFNNVVVIDHHKVDENCIKSNYSFIESKMSSASEIMYNLLKKYNIKPYSYLANALYAGIYLDTRRFGKFNEYIAFTIAELLQYGASHDDVKKLFNRNDFSAIREEKRLIHDLIENTEIIAKNYALTFNNVVPDTVYSREILGKTADELIENYEVSTSFVIGFVDKAEMGDGHSDTIHISARSTSIDVSSVMRQIGGGGRPEAAAATFVECNIYEVYDILAKALYKSVVGEVSKEEDIKKLVLMPIDVNKQILK